ncbi:MAG: type II secretion system F family protein [Gemmataceae bacterium]
MTADELTALNDQIAALARAGLPLDQGLDSLARDMARGRLRAVTAALAADLRAGHTLPEALARQDGRVPAYYANLVLAGVQTGRLPEVLATLTTYARSVAATRTIVTEALFYPAVVLALGVALFATLAGFVLPQFDQIFREFGLQLPWITEAVLVFGRHPIELVVVPAAVLFVGPLLARAVLRRSARGRLLWARLVYLVPMVGGLIRTARLAAFTELLGLLVEYGVPLPAAVRLAGGASSDPGMAAEAETVEARLAEGTGLAEAFRGRGLVPDWVAWLAAAGERRGGLGPALREAAAVYRRQVDARAAVLRSVLPPFVVVITAGSLTTCFVVAIMAPLLKLLEGLSK